MTVMEYMNAHREDMEPCECVILPDGSVEDWVAHAYADVPQRIWPVAQRSLIAHVERIRALGPGND